MSECINSHTEMESIFFKLIELDAFELDEKSGSFDARIEVSPASYVRICNLAFALDDFWIMGNFRIRFFLTRELTGKRWKHGTEVRNV